MSTPRRFAPRSLTLFAGLAILAAPLSAQVASGELKVLPTAGAAGDEFGHAVALQSGVLAVGAPRADAAGVDSGSAYLFDANTGAQLFELAPLDAASGDLFGFSIAIDGGTVVVGALADDDNGVNSGSAYLFDRFTGTQIAKLVSIDGQAGDEFGYSVAIQDGLVVVGSKRDDDNGVDSGSAYLFDAATGAQLGKLLANDGAANDNFGEAVDIDGGVVAIGAHGDGFLAGAAYLFDATGGTQLFKLTPDNGQSNDFFGQAVAIDAGVVVVGASYKSMKGKHSGTAYLFDSSTGAEIAQLTPADGAPFDRFGYSVAVGDGTLIVGSMRDTAVGFNGGSAYLFDLSGNPVDKLLASDGTSGDNFGWSVAAAGGRVVAGAIGDDDAGDKSGSAYVFDAASSESPWIDLGGGAPGLAGVPALTASGQIAPGSTLGIELSQAPPSAALLLMYSNTSVPLELFGGTLHAFPLTAQFLVVSDPFGEWSLSIQWPASIPSGADLYLQFLVHDTSVPDQLTLSNAVRATAP